MNALAFYPRKLVREVTFEGHKMVHFVTGKVVAVVVA